MCIKTAVTRDAAGFSEYFRMTVRAPRRIRLVPHWAKGAQYGYMPRRRATISNPVTIDLIDAVLRTFGHSPRLLALCGEEVKVDGRI